MIQPALTPPEVVGLRLGIWVGGKVIGAAVGDAVGEDCFDVGAGVGEDEFGVCADPFIVGRGVDELDRDVAIGVGGGVDALDSGDDEFAFGEDEFAFNVGRGVG